MPRKKRIAADDLRKIMELCIALEDMPVSELKFDSEDADLDLREDLPFLADVIGKKPAPDATMLPVSGTHPICIRVPARVIRAFKLRADKTGCSYQTLMNRALAAAVKD